MSRDVGTALVGFDAVKPRNDFIDTVGLVQAEDVAGVLRVESARSVESFALGLCVTHVNDRRHLAWVGARALGCAWPNAEDPTRLTAGGRRTEGLSVRTMEIGDDEWRAAGVQAGRLVLAVWIRDSTTEL